MLDVNGGGEARALGHAVRAPERDERVELLEILALAFRENPMNRAIHGSDPGQRLRANRAGLRALVLRESPRLEVRVGLIGRQVAGGFVAMRPGEFPSRPPSIVDQIGCVYHQGIRAMRKWGFVNQALLAVHPMEAHWYLAVLGVAPWAWRRGLGRELVEELGRLVDREPAPIYLESDRPESVSFYLGLGFETRTRDRILGVECVALERRPGFHSF